MALIPLHSPHQFLLTNNFMSFIVPIPKTKSDWPAHFSFAGQITRSVCGLTAQMADPTSRSSLGPVSMKAGLDSLQALNGLQAA